MWNGDDIDSTWVSPAIFAAIGLAVLTYLVFEWGDAARLRRWWRRRSATSGR
ncbi:hypothetical protein [Curtobacterium oceanosedimentum]|uniref:hypothetical protein n=1 Tax=Curtobacterium oceanosedimentum TaxID=465820 RepID=UPI00339A9E38